MSGPEPPANLLVTASAAIAECAFRVTAKRSTLA
jgi:hypothetical protein